MTDTRLLRHCWPGNIKFSLIVAVGTLVCSAQFAQAQSASFRIGENASVVRAAIDLDNGDISQSEFDSILLQTACQNPYARLRDRNRPFLAVINTSDTDDEITTVDINLEEAGFEFGNGDADGDGFEGLLSMLSIASDDGVELDSAVYGADNSELQLSFSGLSPGQAAIFRVDIDEPNGLYLFPDYRDAFQGANEGNGRDGDLALLSTTFSSGAMTNALFPQVGLLTTAGQVEAYHAQTMVPPDTSVVPEPASVCLMLAGLCGLSATRRRR